MRFRRTNLTTTKEQNETQEVQRPSKNKKSENRKMISAAEYLEMVAQNRPNLNTETTDYSRSEKIQKTAEAIGRTDIWESLKEQIPSEDFFAEKMVKVPSNGMLFIRILEQQLQFHKFVSALRDNGGELTEKLLEIDDPIDIDDALKKMVNDCANYVHLVFGDYAELRSQLTESRREVSNLQSDLIDSQHELRNAVQALADAKKKPVAKRNQGVRSGTSGYVPHRRRSGSVRDRARLALCDVNFCAYCDEEFATDRSFHVDHVIPIAKGGPDDLWNLVKACIPCNMAKSASAWLPVYGTPYADGSLETRHGGGRYVLLNY